MEKSNRSKTYNLFHLILKMIRYNMRVIFGNRFIWFLLVSLGFLIFIAITAVLDGDNTNEELVYNILVFPGLLLVFYPMTFGIQSDSDAGILEILFGIPDYRYKVWLVRMIMVFILVSFIIFGYSILCRIFITELNLFQMTYQLMYPIVFVGCLSFMFSTIIKNGYGTMAIMIILGVILMIVSNAVFENTQWDVFLNPFNMPRNLNETIWQNIIVKNRIFLAISSLIFMLYGLFNLQKRERFI